MFARTQSTGSQKDWLNYYQAKRIAQRECHNAHNEYVSHLIDPNKKSTTKRFWSYIKSQHPDCCGVPSLRHGDNVIEGDLDKTEALNKQFASVFTIEDKSNIPLMNNSSYPDI